MILPVASGSWALAMGVNSLSSAYFTSHFKFS